MPVPRSRSTTSAVNESYFISARHQSVDVPTIYAVAKSGHRLLAGSGHALGQFDVITGHYRQLVDPAGSPDVHPGCLVTCLVAGCLYLLGIRFRTFIRGLRCSICTVVKLSLPKPYPRRSAARWYSSRIPLRRWCLSHRGRE